MIANKHCGGEHLALLVPQLPAPQVQVLMEDLELGVKVINLRKEITGSREKIESLTTQLSHLPSSTPTGERARIKG